MMRRKPELSPRRYVRSLSKELDISETSTFIPALKRKGVYERTILQQDGAPQHCSKVTIEWLTEKCGKKGSSQGIQASSVYIYKCSLFD
jgi:hypothetical protein